MQMQRLLDVIFSLIALIMLFPLLLIVAFTVWLLGDGKVLFRQTRVGQGGKLIDVLKFSTMKQGSHPLGEVVIDHNDPSLLPAGAFLRKSKLNELPQLFNILVGDMSVIGPRPHTPDGFEKFPSFARTEILKVRPGLSGIGSIIFHDEEEILEAQSDPYRFFQEVIMPYKGILEVWYVENASVKLYFLLIILTVVCLLNPENGIVWRIFPTLPHPPSSLRPYLRTD
jgi:lipopolysaccharide/colanic/teichoic acid biosynthesis glycosyltransferase